MASQPNSQLKKVEPGILGNCAKEVAMKAFRFADENTLCKRRRLHNGGNFLMRPFIRGWYRAGLVGGAALALSLVPMTTRGQQVPAQTASSTETAVGQQNTNPDLDRMDQFLNDHKDIDKDLRANPSLMTDHKYLDHHKDLRKFLNDNPRMQREFAGNRAYFTHREGRFDARADARTNQSSTAQQAINSRNQDRDRDQNNADQDRDRYGNEQNPGLRTGEAAQLDRFFDDHQQVEKDLTANPSLANNNTYLDQHQDLRTFLNAHPDLREQFAKNPSLFMQRENQFENSARDRDQDRARYANGQNQQNGYAANNSPDRDQDRDRHANGQNPNPDVRTWEVARADQFLDDHQDIERDLRANPSLVN
ncbi:MAG: hypothetical protein ACRD3B_16695, partial [Candidatus Sulfotelmatobacter sp.]